MPIVLARAPALKKQRPERRFSHIQPVPFNFSMGCEDRLEIAEDDECCYKTPAAKEYGTPVVRTLERAPKKQRPERLFSHIQPLPFDFSPSNFSMGCKDRLRSPAFSKLEIAEEDENRCKTPAVKQCGMPVVLARAPDLKKQRPERLFSHIQPLPFEFSMGCEDRLEIAEDDECCYKTPAAKEYGTPVVRARARTPKKQRPVRLFSHIQPLPFDFSPNFSMGCEDRLLSPAFSKLEIAKEDDACCYKTPAGKENGIPDVLTCAPTPKNERAEWFCSNIQPLPFDLSPKKILMGCEDCVLSPAFSKLELEEREHECCRKTATAKEYGIPNLHTCAPPLKKETGRRTLFQYPPRLFR